MGRRKYIETPKKLWEHFTKYSLECKKSPKQENFWSSKSDKQVSVDREIPLTWEGFEVWLRRNGIIAKLDDYKANKEERYSDYADILHAIEVEIWSDQYDGAAAGIFQHNIVARKLGLIDKQDHNIAGGLDLSELNIKIIKSDDNSEN